MTRRMLAALPAGLLALGLLAAALAAAIAMEWRGGLAPSSPRPVAGAVQVPALPGPQLNDLVKAGTVRYVAAILARPLFSPNRRADATAASGSVTLPRLAGVVVSSAGKVAIFAGATGAKPVVVGEGEHVGAYLVGPIEAGGVTIVGVDGSRVVHPSFDPNPPAKPFAAAAPIHAMIVPAGK